MRSSSREVFQWHCTKEVNEYHSEIQYLTEILPISGLPWQSNRHFVLPLQGVTSSISGPGTKIPHAEWPKKKKKKWEEFCLSPLFVNDYLEQPFSCLATCPLGFLFLVVQRQHRILKNSQTAWWCWKLSHPRSHCRSFPLTLMGKNT